MADTMQTSSASTLRSTGDAPVERALNEAKDIGTELMSAVCDSATAIYQEQRNRAADEIASMGNVLRRSVQSLDQTDGVIARCGGEAARQIDDFATRLRTRSWSELTGDLEEFARRNPMLFIGAATGLGFLAGRFLTASATELVAGASTAGASTAGASTAGASTAGASTAGASTSGWQTSRQGGVGNGAAGRFGGDN